MARRPKVQRSPEEKLAIVMEALKSGNVAETCHKHEIAPRCSTAGRTKWGRDHWLRLGGRAQPHGPTKSRANASSNWNVLWAGRTCRSRS
jgi:transposase-like protein